jgi:simple sugar transport system ATP-binding protein
VLVVSEELEELFEVSDRLHVISKGQLSPPVAMADASMERIGLWMSGLWDEDLQRHLADLEQDTAPAVTLATGVHHAQA